MFRIKSQLRLRAENDRESVWVRREGESVFLREREMERETKRERVREGRGERECERVRA